MEARALRFCAYFFFCYLLTLYSARADSVRVQLEGLNGQLEKNVRLHIEALTQGENTDDGRFRTRVDKAIKEGLRALGYYEPSINLDYISTIPEQNQKILLAQISPGEPVNVERTTVIIRGEAKEDKDYQTWVEKNQPPLHTELNHGRYRNFKYGLNDLALEKGYFDSEFIKSELGVSVERHLAFWDIDYDSGVRYRFGEVTFNGAQIKEAYLQNLAPFKYGDFYQSSQLAEFNRRLSATGWFSSVVVAPEFDEGRKTKILPLHADISPRNKNAVELGAGFSTDVGPRLKVIWKRPWINSDGHSMDANVHLAKPEQQMDVSYKIPLLKSPLEQYYIFQTGLKRTDLNDTRSDSSLLSLSRHWDASTGWQKSLSLRWSLDHFTQGDDTDTSMLIYPGASINRTRSRGKLLPWWGDTQRYSIDWSNTIWGSNVDFLVLRAQDVLLRTFKDKHRVILRANLGFIETGDFTKVPPSLRFFAGGDRSIRGYKYQSISPQDSNGNLIGASTLITGSMEYQYNVTGKWWGAGFLDSGEAVNDIKRSNFKTGAGFGVRWQSPVGPVKLDIAVPLADRVFRDVQFYIGLGPEL